MKMLITQGDFNTEFQHIKSFKLYKNLNVDLPKGGRNNRPKTSVQKVNIFPTKNLRAGSDQLLQSQGTISGENNSRKNI